MTVEELALEYHSTRSPGWLVLSEPETCQCALEALRYCAAYMAVESITRHADALPGASEPGTPVPVAVYEGDQVESLPIKDMELLDLDTELTTGEWMIVRPLFALYVEKENALRLEASRAMGLEPYGRQASEVAQDITIMESQTIPAATFVHAIIEV